MHIKYGYIHSDPYYVVKIASGFYQNEALGLPNNDGLMMVFNARTGAPEVLLQDEGYLTDLRTALAGAVTAQNMAPENIKAIGIIGTGVQARLQLSLLSWVTDCREVYVYGRNDDKVLSYAAEMRLEGFSITKCDSPKEVAVHCNLIVTTTAASSPLLRASDIQLGTHITAMGSDAPGKQELDADILELADLVACDSKSQCIHHGETHFAVANRVVSEAKIVEVGDLINQPIFRQPDDITVADLTGIATQDIKIAGFVLAASDQN
jgi:ornithine cyclodeaminase